MSEYQNDPYHAQPLSPEEEALVHEMSEAPTAEFGKTREFHSGGYDAYQEYVARRRKTQPLVVREPREHFAAHLVVCLIAAGLACIPIVGWIPASILWWIDIKWLKVSEGTYRGGGSIPVRVTQ